MVIAKNQRTGIGAGVGEAISSLEYFSLSRHPTATSQALAVPSDLILNTHLTGTGFMPGRRSTISNTMII